MTDISISDIFVLFEVEPPSDVRMCGTAYTLAKALEWSESKPERGACLLPVDSLCEGETL
jgi:hypothetical protein